MKDTFNRKIDYLRISVTDRCNLKCIYCRPSKGPDYYKPSELMTAEEIRRIVQITVKHGLRKVRITGGEPLVRKDIVSIIESLKDSGVKDLSITTNGTLLGREIKNLMDAGLGRINISLDTMSPVKYSEMTNGGNIEAVRDSIRQSEEAGLSPIKINMVPIRGINDDEILAFAQLTMEKDYHIRFIEFMPANCSGLWTKDKCVTGEEILKTISAIGDLDLLEFKGQGPSRNYRIKGAKGIIGIISPVSDHFCNFCNRMRLTSTGSLRPCLFSKDEIDIKTPMRNGASDDEIEALFLMAVRIKPEGHELNHSAASRSSIDTMSKIGG
ncbi:MAG: GTP 3',8-cyclase MoaA [Nitrospira sp.]|nr:GTP 3',8-cyclase MoaA [bacterium]MBL7049832.1 GTP 3',8-cyclase MoaA [Nitrospira sp.]